MLTKPQAICARLNATLNLFGLFRYEVSRLHYAENM